MEKMLIIGDYGKLKQLKYANYIIDEYSDQYEILVAGQNINIIKNFDLVKNLKNRYSDQREDVYAYFVFSASIVIVLHQKINYHKYKKNQRIIYFEQNQINEISNEKFFEGKYKAFKHATDYIKFNSTNKIEKKLAVNIYSYELEFNDSNVKDVISRLKIEPNVKIFKNDILIISNELSKNVKSKHNLHNLLKKIDKEYDSYTTILLYLKVLSFNRSELEANYTNVVDKFDSNILKYLKYFEGILIYDSQEILDEFEDLLSENSLVNKSKKIILEEKAKLFFDKNDIQQYLFEVDNKIVLSKRDYTNCLDNMYDDEIKSKKISVVICTYNTPNKLLFRAINSAFESTHKNIEVIIVDDGSKLNLSKDLNERFKNEDIHYYYQENVGSGLARNNGIKDSTGDYIFFLDSDDTITKYGLQYMLTHAAIFNLDLVIGKRFIFNENGMFLTESFDNISSNTYNCYHKHYQHSVYYDNMPNNKLISREVFEKYDIWFESGLYEDAPFTALLYSQIPEYHYVNIPIHNWFKYGEETTISSRRDYGNFSQRVNAYEITWNIIPEFMKEGILTANQDAFNLYLSSFLKYSIEEKKSFFCSYKNYFIPKLTYYTKYKKSLVSDLIVESLINDDYDSFASICRDYTMKVGCIIQARNASTRLPGKVLMPLPLAMESTVLEHVIKRVQRVNLIDEIIIATTINEVDNSIEELARKLGVKSFRGSEANVLSRYYEAATQNDLDIIVRITSDCPCIDYEVLQRLIKYHLLNKNDYTSNTFIRTFPHGLDAEVINYDVLKQAYHNATDQFEIEHVTPYIYKTNKDNFKIGNYENQLMPESSKIRITLDTQEDYMLLCAVFDYFKEKQDFLLQDIIDLYDKKPWLYLINNNIVQKRKYDSKEMEIKAAVEILEKQELDNAVDILKKSTIGVYADDQNIN